MSSDIKKMFLYGVLLIAGVTFGMQLAELGNKDTYGSGWQQQNNVSNGAQSYTVPQSQFPQAESPQFYVQQPQIPSQQTGQGQQLQQSQQMQAQTPQSTAPTITTPSDILLPPATKPSVDKFADKTANLLQKLSKQGIDWVASLFGTTE